jgi:monoterpene epsilon-lactone hydrolase
LRIGHRAKEAGIAVELDIWHKMPHVWHLLPRLPEGALAVEDIGDFIHRATDIDR